MADRHSCDRVPRDDLRAASGVSLRRARAAGRLTARRDDSLQSPAVLRRPDLDGLGWRANSIRDDARANGAIWGGVTRRSYAPCARCRHEAVVSPRWALNRAAPAADLPHDPR